MVKPHIRVVPPDEEEEVPIPTERIQDVDSAFSVDQDSGIIKAGQTMAFNLTFAPPEVGIFLFSASSRFSLLYDWL